MITRKDKLLVYKLALQKVIKDLEHGEKFKELNINYKVSGLCPIIQGCHNEHFLYSKTKMSIIKAGVDAPITLEVYHVPEVYNEILKYILVG